MIGDDAALEQLSPHALASALALISAVIVIAALLSGLVERSGIPQVAVFLALGAGLGPAGLDVLSIGLDSLALQIAATLSLALILFTDALSLDLREVGAHRGLVLRVVGPGTLLAAAVFSGLAWWWLALPPAAAAILGAALASTDPVLLKGLLQRGDLGSGARLALRLESGLNDVVLLPIVLVACALSLPDGARGGAFAELATDLMLLGPAAGVAVGVGGLATLDLVRRRIGVRRDYESLYSLGMAFAAYAAAESVGGSGFLAAFAAGLTIAAFDVELCDCFREYGETTAELALLLTFVLLGSSLIWTGVSSAGLAELGFALVVLIARAPVMLAALAGARIDRAERRVVAWFGPRGLSTLLLVLLAVFLGVPQSDVLFRIACLVVLLSVAAHGTALIWIGRRGDGAAPPDPLPPRSTPALPPAEAGSVADRVRIQVSELQALLAAGVGPAVIDVRSRASWAQADVQAQGARRLAPDELVRGARRLGLPHDRWIVLYCT